MFDTHARLQAKLEVARLNLKARESQVSQLRAALHEALKLRSAAVHAYGEARDILNELEAGEVR